MPERSTTGRSYGKGRKVWAKPKLTVITRGNRQEGVLSGCKAGSGSGSGGSYNRCAYISGGCYGCSAGYGGS